MTTRYDIVNRDKLLSEIAEQLRNPRRRENENLHRVALGCIEVVLYEDGVERLRTDLATALHFIADDIYYNERDDWSCADRAEVSVM